MNYGIKPVFYESKYGQYYQEAVLPNHELELFNPDIIYIHTMNRNPKNKNFEEKADRLNLLPESLVFIDDNPVERNIVIEQIPGVAAPEIGAAHQFIQNIDRNVF